jgi:Arc/MetJ family transcription regulator
MRMHIELEDELVARIDEIAGARGRSAFVRKAVESAVAEETRWARLRAAAGAIPDKGHGWDDDPAQWVRDQRRGDLRRGG